MERRFFCCAQEMFLRVVVGGGLGGGCGGSGGLGRVAGLWLAGWDEVGALRVWGGGWGGWCGLWWWGWDVWWCVSVPGGGCACWYLSGVWVPFFLRGGGACRAVCVFPGCGGGLWGAGLCVAVGVCLVASLWFVFGGECFWRGGLLCLGAVLGGGVFSLGGRLGVVAGLWVCGVGVSISLSSSSPLLPFFLPLSLLSLFFLFSLVLLFLLLFFFFIKGACQRLSSKRASVRKMLAQPRI